VTLRLFAAAREAAGVTSVPFEATTLDDLLDAARAQFGGEFAAVLDAARVWVDGEDAPAGGATVLTDGSEVAVLPPVSGGAGAG
jgi:molybdopterin synthase sulfur carrier subunit